MPNKVTYTITTSDGKEHQVSKENVDKYGIQSYADAYKGATIRMRDAQKGDYDIPLQHFDNARKQGLHAFSLEHVPVQKQTTPKPTPTPSVTTAATPQDIVQSPRPQSQKDRPMTAVEKASMISNVGNIVNTTQAGLQRTKNMMTYAKSKAGLHVEPVKLGKKNNVVETAKQYNPKTGKMQSHYLTEAGNEYDDKTQADIEQAAIDDQKRRELDPVQSQLEDAYSERDRLEEAVSVRRKELEDEYNNRPWYQRILTEMGKASHSNVDPAAISTDPEHMGFAQDEQYMQLMSAIRKNHQTIQTLEDKKNGQMNSFWHSLGTTLANGYIFADGLPEMRDATAILNAQKHIDSINRKRKTGQALTKEEAAAEAVLRNTQVDNVVQGTYGSEYGAWARAGRGTAYSADFLKDFLLFPNAANIAKGVAGKVAGIGGKYLAKTAGETAVKATAKAIARATLKATGVVVGAHTAGAVISNTTGIGRTVAKMGQLSAGDVSMDKNGNYKMENQQDLMSAFAEAEREQARENGSEMFGEFIPGGKVLSGAAKNALSKIGLGRISNMLTSIGNKAWYKNYTNLLSKGGYNGIPGEALEEYEGMFFDAITGHADEAVRDFTDPKQQVDIWLGCAAMGALMGAAPMGMHTQGYYRYKHGMNRADRTADFRLTPQKWQPLKEQIDQTDNGNMAGFVVDKILNNKSLEPQEKEAAMNYVRNLTKFRGFNIAQVNNADDEAKDTQIESRQQNEAYSMGYNLQDEKELNNTAILYDEAKKQAIKTTGWDEDALDRMIGEDGGASTLAYMKRSDEFNDEQLQAFTDYANARSAYNGMIQRVKDDIDTKVHESNLEVDQRTNLDTGAIHPATMKVDNRQVYIVNGNVVMLPDGSGVDHEHSDDFVVLRDADTGELETADPSAIFKVDTPINAQEEKGIAADNIRQTVAQQQADKIDGKLEFKQGDTYSIIDKEDGTQHSLSIIGDAIDEKTGQVNPEMVLVDIDGAQQPILLPKEQVQQQVDEARRAAVAATQVVENAPTTNTNNTYSINDEVTLSDENGNTVRGSITAPENEDGKFEVYTEQPINGKKVNLFSAEELDTMTKAPTDVAENTTTQQPQQQEETEESVEKETPKQQPTALERIPKDESGQPLYEQAEPETAWDAIVEQTEGDTSMAQTVADDMVSDLEAGVKKAEKTKTKSGGSIAEKIAAEKERAAVIEQAKATLAHWRKIAAVNRMREAAIQAEEQRKADEVARVRKEQEEKERVEQEEAERIKREALNGVPDFVEDKATDARARGYRRVNGDKVDRQEPINATKGKEVQVKFDDDNIPTGHVAIIEANLLQPSHKNGQRNPQHFIDEAQPKERKDDASVGAARKIAANIRPEEITSSVTAYTGAPTVNSRGEVIQGNNRSAALREMWDNHQEQGDKYKQYLIDNAESFGLKAEDIAAMDKPVLVNMLDVNDDEAISLGQFVASDTESGGTERIKPKNVVKKLGDKMKNFANILLRANDENISFAELVDSNGVDALKWLNANGAISPTQYKSAFDSKGNITAEAKNDIKGIMYQSIFEGGNTQLEEMLNALPAKAQKAILATAYRDYDSPQSERMIGDIQDSIMAYYALSHDSMFMNAKNHKDARIAVEAWRRQLAFDDVTGESYLPAEKYSNFALLLATMYKGDNQSLIQGTFNKMYDLIQGTQEETLFEQPDNTPRSLAQAIKETLNIEYNGQQGSNVLAGDNSASQEGRTGSNGDTTPRGRSENIDGAEANQGGTEGDTGRSGSGQSSGGSQEEVAAVNSHLTKKEAADFIAQMELGADVAQEIPLTIENWDKEFGEDGIVSTPIGDVKMGENQFAKLMRAGRNGKLGMLKPTLEYPDAIVEENSKAKEGTHTERPSSFIFIKSFRKSDGTRYYYFTSITVSVDGKEVVVSNQEKSRNRILRLLMEGSVIWRTPKDATTSSAEKQGLDYVHPDKAEGETKGSVITPQNTPSVGKDKQSSATKQEIVDNYLEKPASSEDLFAKAERVAEEDKAKRTRKKEEAKVDTNPTEAQKEAGNYKKGHIKVDGFNVTIEQPKGSVRRGKDANGKEWETEMHNTYGYIRGTESVDGDHIDIFLSDNPTEGNVFVVDQVNQDGSFDEHKVMYGFSDMESARKAYLSNYEEGWQGLGNITEVSKEEFKKWIDSSKRKTKPFAEYKSVRPEMGIGFDTEHAQSSDNYAHNSEKVRKAINAYEDAQEKFDNLFSLLVKEKESKPFDTREWREVNRTKEELKDVLLQLNTKELGELLKQVSGKDTENVIKNVLDIVNREEHRLIAFNAILDKQSYITPEYKEGEKAIPVSEFVETDKKRAEIYTILTGVFHDKGYVVGTDAYLLLARKEDYDKSLEGKVTNKKGEVVNGKYPNWRAVVNSEKQGKSWGVNLEELHAFTRGVLTKLKIEKANPSTKKDAKIAFKTADGKIVLCYANALDKALQGAKSIGAKSFFGNDDGFAITQTPKGYVICPMLNQDQNIDDNSFAYVPRVSELQHSTETLSNDTEAKRLATGGLKIHQAKKSQKESKDSNVFLSHKEYIEKELVSALKQTKYKTLEEWEDKDTENYAQKYDDILETYKDYVRDLADDEKLQAIYDKSSVKTQKEIREHLTDADLDYHEFINTSPKRLRIQDRLTRKSKYAKGEFSDGTIVSGEVVRWSPTSLTVNSRGTLYTISANKVLEQSNEPMNADGHEYQENGSLQYSTEDLTNNTTAKRLVTDTILSALNKAGIEVVRATDEQVQELLANTHATSLRTSQGTIYGWSINGKIYLTEAGINPDTPIHEYTHLWAEAMMSKNKQGWNNIKTLLKGTSVWEEVVSDSNYSNITNNEDAVASEVLSRISGRENAARMESEAQKVIDEDKDVFEKAKSVTLLNRIKRALDMFWKWVGKELFKIKKFGSINEVTDRVLYDLMHSTKLNSNDKSLIGVHNISEQKLRKVLKQGGFANPSIAVIDTDKQVHNDYGEISLILPSRKINKSTGKNAGTFEGDAWTPMYPVVEKQISSDGRITIHNDINAVPKDMQSEVRNALNRWLENGSDTDLSYLYLFQQGKAPQMIVEKPKYSNEVHKTLNDIMFGVNSVYNLSKNEIKKLVELYIQTELDGNIKEYNEAIQRKISKYEELIKRGKPNSLRYRVADSYLEDIEKYGYPLSPLINFVNDVQRDKIKQGSKNAQKTLNTASQIIKDAGLEKDFKNWVEGLNNRYQTKEVIFDGFTPTGKRRYIPNTLENVSKIMKKQGRQASAGISISFSNFAAAVMKANGSLDNIRKKKSKLTNEHKDIEDFEEKWKEVYFDLAMKLQPNANMFDDYGFARLQEAANEKNPQTYIRNVYGITLSEEDVQKLQDLVKAIREERPALYFETKFERPVYLNEFSKAVVPEDFSDDLQNALRESGIEVFTYKRGDVEDRQRVTKQAAYSSNDIAFQVINNSRDGNNTDRFTDGLNAVNEQFNRELAGLTEENADTKIFNLGSPSSILLSAGVEDKPMKLYGNKIIKKMKKHGFALAELQDLPKAVANPIAVFDNYQREGNRSILTELRSQGKNIMVVITLGKNGVDVDFNIVSSVFAKRESNVVDWINKGYLTYINKEKALNYLYFSERGISKAADNVGQEDSNNLYLSAPIAEAAENPELSSAAKIVKDFVNPVIQDENLLRDDTDTLSDIDSEENAPFANDAARSHAFDKEVNEQFNRELAELTEENAQSKRLKLGYPSPMLSAAGVPDKPIILYGNKLLKKAKLHNFDVKELHNLPLAMQNPIAVFEGSHPNSFATLLEIKLGGHNTLASIEVNKKGEADFNFISSLFGKESKGVTKWILDGKLLSVDKEKAQSYISASALNADATYKNELSSAAKIVKDFVNPNIDEEKLREGYGSYNNTELSFINDPVAKMLGKSNRTEEDHKAFAERERQRMISRISELADRLHLDNIETVTDSNSLQGKKAKAKGFYSKSSGKITIVIPNHASVEDVEKTLLHEAVAHYGLRKLFGEHFEAFLDNVYQNVEPEIRRIITSQAANNNWDFRTATEEYLAGLAERTDFERVHYAIWNKIKSLFLKMLHSIGFEGWSATELSDNELRYLLWRSYENMKEPGRYRSILGEAEDIAKQNELKVGNYDQQDTNSSNVAESKTETENTLYRQGSNGQSAYDIYENAVKDSGTQTMLGALARTVFSKDARTRFKNKFAESYFDYSRSIKQLQDAIEESLGVKLDSYEDVWRTLNAKGSADAQEVNLAMLRYIAPLADYIGYMIKGKSLNGEVLTVDDVEKYMNAVHGIERNKHMQEAAFRDKLIKKLKSEGYSNDESEAIVEAELDNIRKGNGSMYMDIYDNVRKDYSGLTTLFSDEVEDVDNIDELEAAATQYANDFGKTVGMDKTLELWDKVRALNDFSLRKSYLSGLISKAQYEGVKQMFQYYVPLRGWYEGAAGDIYEYISRGERAGMLESTLKVAKGRKSRAGDILGTMAAMANTAIVQGNRNLVAQKFLNMALNYGGKSGLLMVGKQWYEESANEELIPLFPNLHDGMTVQEQQDEIERFEKDMEEKRKAGRVRELRKGFNKEVGLRMPKWQEQEHCVRVLRNGREHQVYVLGNPRAAQAFNGLLNKQAKSDLLTDGWAALMRAKATMQTSLSPEFIFSNFQRDILTAGTGTYIKFGRKAGVEFAKNLTMLNPMAGMSEGRTGGIFTLIYRYNKGTLDMSNEVERMFDEFVRNGGMTGVSIIEGKDEYQKSINEAVRRIKQGKLNMGRQAIHGLADAIEFMNSGVENSTRFAAYMVSRKTLGKSVTESVFDAKEASVNFNMKGSGAWLNLWMRRNILYANPAIQSVRMLGTWYDASPKRFMGVLSTIIATSVTMAMLWASIGAGAGDDDNDWYKLSEWNRYNYLNVWTGNGYAHWSLPQEFRPAWALGQIVFDWQRGMVSKERAINSMMTQLNNLSPMAFFSGGMDSKDSYWKTAIRAWTPTIAADFADAYVWNENFLGQKITNQEDYNIDSPEFQRAGKNTPQWAVSLSKLWNNVTGGAENRKSYWDSPALNPSALYYLAQQQLGGFGTMVTKLSKAYEQLEDPNGELEAKNIPFVSKVWVSTEDKQSKNRVTDDKFWMIYNDWKLIDSEMKHNKSDVEKGKMSLTDLAERMNELQQNGDHKRWARLRGYMKGYDELRKARNNGADVEEAMDELKKDVVKEEEKTLTSK